MRKEANHRYFSFQIISGVTLLLCQNFLHMSLATSLVRSTMARQRPIIIAASMRAKQSPVQRGRISCLHLLVSSWVLTHQNKIKKNSILIIIFVCLFLFVVTDNLSQVTQRQLGANVRGSRLMPSLSEEKKKTKIASSHDEKKSSLKNIKRKER